jgi:hypothetical protein
VHCSACTACSAPVHILPVDVLREKGKKCGIRSIQVKQMKHLFETYNMENEQF